MHYHSAPHCGTTPYIPCETVCVSLLVLTYCNVDGQSIAR
jgi:hypothetical protein